MVEADGNSLAGEDDADDAESEHETGDIGRYWTRKKSYSVSLVEKTATGSVQQSALERSPEPVSEPASGPVPETEAAPSPAPELTSPKPTSERTGTLRCVVDILEPSAIHITCDALFGGFRLAFKSCESLLDRNALVLPGFGEGMSRAQLTAMRELRSKALVLRDEAISRWTRQIVRAPLAPIISCD